MISKAASILFFLFFFVSTYSQSEIYELRVYEMEFSKPAEVLHDYLTRALIPALNRNGLEKIGAFEETGETLPKKIYVLIAYPDMKVHQEVADKLANDEQFKSDAESYMKAPTDQIPFKRIETTFIRSAKGFPKLVKPAEHSELFELRIYESYNEDALRRKVKMFNDSEFDIFEDIGHHMVFFGANISGDQMPCLTYLIASKDMAENKEAWSKFGPHPEWQRIVNLEEYKNTVSSITRVFLKPLVYSQL
jgi:hypothetical protein